MQGEKSKREREKKDTEGLSEEEKREMEKRVEIMEENDPFN